MAGAIIRNYLKNKVLSLLTDLLKTIIQSQTLCKEML